MDMNWRLHTIERVFIMEAETIPDNFTGMARTIQYLVPTQRWFKNGQYHRIDGPAIEYGNGTDVYYLNDEKIKCDSIEQFKLLVDIMKLKGLTL